MSYSIREILIKMQVQQHQSNSVNGLQQHYQDQLIYWTYQHMNGVQSAVLILFSAFWVSCINTGRDFHQKPYQDLSIVLLDTISIDNSTPNPTSSESTEMVIHASSGLSFCPMLYSIDISLTIFM